MIPALLAAITAVNIGIAAGYWIAKHEEPEQ